MNINCYKKNINASSFVKKIIQGTFWMTFGSLISRGLLSLASIILARILTVDQYGEFGMVKATMDNFLIFASMGIGLTTTKYVSELKDNDKKKASSIIGASISLVVLLSLIIAFIIAIFSNYISNHFLNNPSIQIPLVIGGFTLIFIALNGTQMGALLGLQSYKGNSISNILQGIFLFLGLCIGAYFGGVLGAILGNFTSIILVSIVLQIILRQEAKKNDITINFNDWKHNTKKIYKFAVPASLSTIIVAPTIWILNSMLVNQSNGYKELGLYSAVIIFSTAIQMFNGAIGNVLLPLFLSKSEEITPKKEFFNYFGPWIISILLSIPLIAYPEIVSLILGEKYRIEDILPVLELSILSTLIIANKGGISRDLIMKNKMWLSVFSMGQWAMTTFAIFYFIKGQGAFGFTLAYLIGYIINYLVMIPFFIKKKISPSYIFYNIWVFTIWVSLAMMIYINIKYFNNYIVRLIAFFLLNGVLFFSIIKLYVKIIHRQTINKINSKGF